MSNFIIVGLVLMANAAFTLWCVSKAIKVVLDAMIDLDGTTQTLVLDSVEKLVLKLLREDKR